MTAVAWKHPTAGWAHADYAKVWRHCRKDGPLPVPLYETPDAALARVAELEAALDEKEIASGLTRDGNLWRYWSTKAQALAFKVSDLEQQVLEEKTRAMHAEARAVLRERSYEHARNDALEAAAQAAEQIADAVIFALGVSVVQKSAKAKMIDALAASIRGLKEKA
jgi:hypothetical protein